MSDEESLPDDSLLLDDEDGAKCDAKTGISIAKWDSGKWVRIKSGSTELVKFVFEDVSVDDDQELPVCWFEWDLGDLYLAFPQGDKEKVKVLEIDAADKKINVITDISYRGSIKQILRLENLDKKSVIEKVKISNLFLFIKHYQLQDENEKEDKENETPSMEAIEEETLEKEEESKNNARKRKKKVNGPKKIKIPRFSKVKEPSVSQIENDVIVNLNQRILNEKQPKFNTKLLSLEVLEPDFTFRTLSESNVDFFVGLMRKGLFNSTGNPLIVNKIKNSEKYCIFDGNCRYEATKKHNNETDQKVLTMHCNVYDDLTFDEMVLIRNEAYIKSPQSEITILQTTKIVQKIIFNHNLSVPTKKQDAEFQKLMKTFCNNYLPICTDLLRLPSETLNAIYKISCNNISIEHLALSSAFWNAFIIAVKKDSIKAMEYLASIKTTNDIKNVQKQLKNVELNLLDNLRKRADHSYKTEEEAIKDLSGEKNVTKSCFMKALHDINIFHNKSYDAKKTNVWTNIKNRLKISLEKNMIYKNVKYLKEINDASMSTQNFVVIENPPKSFVEIVEKFQENFVLLMFAFGGEDAPKLSGCLPTAEFEVLVTGLLKIDKILDSVPKNTVKASLYIPNAPKENDKKKKLNFLTELCIEKKCGLAETVPLDDIHEFKKLAENFQNALIHCSSLKITKHFLSNLKDFKSVTVMGDDSQHNLASSFSTTSKNDST